MHVIKIGGNELDSPGFLEALAQAVAASSEPVTIVHGGGKAIADLQAKLGLATIKVDGLRVTDTDSLAVAQMVLSGQANKAIVMALLAAGVDAVGLSGVDGGLLRCQKKVYPTADLGLVGEIVEVRAKLIEMLAEKGITAVISPISLGYDGQAYNVNADEAASAVALALQADILHFISNVPGVIYKDDVLAELTPAQTEDLIAHGVIRDGMVPKVRAALQAIELGVPQARIGNLAGLAAAEGTVFTK
ncbi:MAG: acetylglutamate kinase [Ardenticatenaceae bacterium]|nr:acetylglutamate kinase [Ardenticatenaceae bacterium]